MFDSYFHYNYRIMYLIDVRLKVLKRSFIAFFDSEVETYFYTNDL